MPDYTQYLCDGAYAIYDGYQIWVFTYREEGTHEIALEPETWTALEKYVKDLADTIRKEATGERPDE